MEACHLLVFVEVECVQGESKTVIKYIMKCAIVPQQGLAVWWLQSGAPTVESRV